MRISQEEMESVQLKEETVQLAVHLVKVNWYVLLEEILPRAKVDELRIAFIQGLNRFIEKHGKEIYENKKGFNEGKNHLGILLPFQKPFNDSLRHCSHRTRRFPAGGRRSRCMRIACQYSAIYLR